jgi:hypothetical protein
MLRILGLSPKLYMSITLAVLDRIPRQEARQIKANQTCFPEVT